MTYYSTAVGKATEMVLLPETSVLMTEENVAECEGALVLGQTYTVTFNSKVYSCIAKTVTTGNGDFIALGNGALVGGELTDEPFFMAVVADGQMGIVVLENGTISVRIVTEPPLIDPNYLTDLFIQEAKPALDRHSGSGSSGATPDSPGDVFILVDEAGNEATAVYVEEATVFDATANDIRAGKIAATESGVTVGTLEV